MWVALGILAGFPDVLTWIQAELVHAKLGAVLEIKQQFKTTQGLTVGGVTLLPENEVGLSIIESLKKILQKKIAMKTPRDKYKSWLGEAIERARDSSMPTSLPFLTKSSTNTKTSKVTPVRLKEAIPNTTFIIEDIVYALQNNQPFSEQINISLNQVKVILYYGFLGMRQMITSDVEKTLLQCNVNYDYKLDRGY